MFILCKVLLGYMFGTNMVFILQTVEELLLSVSIKNDCGTLKVGQGHRLSYLFEVWSQYIRGANLVLVHQLHGNSSCVYERCA